ncbi:MAG: SUMO-targeted ubiquitin ligase complex subunit slx8 [Piccolia ochrophora]|nr:MAG: SUMO-targeted ubiquitin ligase complex subunit slx8 [Piccolia ochrophora]
MAPRTRQKRSPNQCRASSDPRSPKRRKGLATSPRKRLKVDPDEGVEEVDLLEVDDDTELSALLRKQREEQVKGQQTDDSGPPSFSALTCIICLDTPTALTVTACGHYFCHQCLMEALIAGETDNRSRCPVCREKVQRTKRSKANYHDFEVLELKLSKRKRKGKGPAVA